MSSNTPTNAPTHSLAEHTLFGAHDLGAQEIVTPKERVENRLKLIFAVQSCLGGLVLSSGDNTESIPVIAIFFAVFGYVFVDVLRLFALPPIAAYAAMTMVALYSVIQFWDMTSSGQTQMIAVGELLVYVQSILMLQIKTRRIFEQLIIFSLLELIVAAVFNNAIYYAFILAPMTLLSVASLCLMSALGTWDGVENDPPPVSNTAAIRAWSPSTTSSFDASVMRFPRMAFLIFGPAVIAVGLIFFYALPRIGNARRIDSSGPVTVGFSKELKLGQMGRMLQNSALAMRVTLTRHNSVRPYRVDNSIYLRGIVAEIYKPGEPDSGDYANWGPVIADHTLGVKAVPPQYISPDPSDSEQFDRVDVEVQCEPMPSDTLFMIAPYHRTGPSFGLRHAVTWWTTQRSVNETGFFPQFEYAFGTTAFNRGQQLRLLAPLSHPVDSLLTLSGNDAVDPVVQLKQARNNFNYRQAQYRRATLDIDLDAQRTAVSTAERVANEMPLRARNPYSIALALERYLQLNESFGYTLNLNFEPIPGLDPIEQFLAVDKKGHCQYFASALAMMLRSQDIPARVVAGYNTDEFNELGNYYMVRQLHAHAWVEALVPRDSVPKEFLNAAGYVPGQIPADEYWLRLDPTPVGGRENRMPPSGMGQVMDLAKNMWDEYVVDMDRVRQDKSLIGQQGKTSMSESYASFIGYMQLQISRIRNGELGGGALAGRQMFSIPAALFGVGLVLTTFALLRLRLPNWLRNRSQRKGSQDVAKPSVAFYAEALQQLGRLGLYREAAQTPAEFTNATIDDTLYPQHKMFAEPLSTLTAAFYRYRFGKDQATRASEQLEPQIESALAKVRENVDRLRGKNT